MANLRGDRLAFVHLAISRGRLGEIKTPSEPHTQLPAGGALQPLAQAILLESFPPPPNEVSPWDSCTGRGDRACDRAHRGWLSTGISRLPLGRFIWRLRLRCDYDTASLLSASAGLRRHSRGRPLSAHTACFNPHPTVRLSYGAMWTTSDLWPFYAEAVFWSLCFSSGLKPVRSRQDSGAHRTGNAMQLARRSALKWWNVNNPRRQQSLPHDNAAGTRRKRRPPEARSPSN